jgi:hypothetical protein
LPERKWKPLRKMTVPSGPRLPKGREALVKERRRKKREKYNWVEVNIVAWFSCGILGVWFLCPGSWRSFFTILFWRFIGRMERHRSIAFLYFEWLLQVWNGSHDVAWTSHLVARTADWKEVGLPCPHPLSMSSSSSLLWTLLQSSLPGPRVHTEQCYSQGIMGRTNRAEEALAISQVANQFLESFG